MPCIFCGAPRVTREHAWPKWIRSGAPKAKDAANLLRGETVAPLRYRGVPFERVLRRVCGECNGGWMARLEEQAKPALSPLVSGTPRTLERAEQQILARWAIKTA